MKFKTLLLLFLLIQASSFSQILQTKELYKQVTNFYRHSTIRFDYIERKFKSALGYDTLRSERAFVSLNDKDFIIVYLDSNYFIKNAFLFSGDYYQLLPDLATRVRIKEKEIISELKQFPSHYFGDLENNFGKVRSLKKVNDQYIIFPKKSFLETPISGALNSILKIDTLTFRITTLIQTASYKSNIQYGEYNYPILPESTEKFIKEQAILLAESAKNFPITTFNELSKKKPIRENFEGEKFIFNKLFTFNKDLLDSALLNKYLIIDFFYQACLPCHKMTGYILDWLPSIDSSRIILVGVDPMDSENAMKLFVRDRGINYPVIIGQQAKDIVRYYQIHVYPTLFLISPNGTIQTIHEGMSKSFLTKIEKIMRE